MANDFLAKIKLALEGLQPTQQGIKAISKDLDELAGKEFHPIFAPLTALKSTSDAISNISKELEGFSIISAKTNDIFKEGEKVGSQTAVTFTNYSGAVKTLSTTMDKTGQVVSQSLQSIGKEAALGLTAIKDFSQELEGFSKVSTKMNTVFEQGQEVGLKSIETYKNQEGTLKSVSSTFDKEGNIIAQSLQEISKVSEMGVFAIKDFSQELEGFGKIGTKTNTIFRSNNEQTKQSIDIYKNQSGAIKQVTTDMDKNGKVIGQSLKEISAGVSKSATMMEQFGMAMKRALIVAPVWMIMRGAIQSVISTIQTQIKFLKELDTAMARIQIVGKGTTEEYNKLKSTLVALSVTYGTVASTALDAAVIFAQQGRTVDETIKLTRVAMIASQILGSDMRTTVDDLTAAIEAFNIPIEESISIIDKWINVEKQFAVTSKDLADATKVAGATANQLGISINAFIGDVTAAVEVTRKTGSEAARAISFIYARLLTTGRPVLEQIAKIPVFLKEGTKATFEQTKSLRPATDVLDELASKWSSLESGERLAIAQTIASKRQLTVFMALMQNYNASLEARIVSLASAGQAEKAFSIIQETVQFKLNQLSASWNSLTTAIGDTSSWKAFLSILTEIIASYVAMINLQQGFEAEAAKVKANNDKTTETFISQRQSLIELIKLRNQYLAHLPDEQTTKMLGKINTAINDVKEAGNIKINIDAEDTIEKLKNQIETEKRINIQFKVDMDINTERAILADKLDNLKTRVKIPTLTLNPITATKNIIQVKKNIQEVQKVEQELNNLEEKRNKILSTQLSKYESEKIIQEASKQFLDDENDISEELTDKEEEKLRDQDKLNVARKLGVLTNQQLLNLEIDLTKQSLFVYDIHEKSLKLTELESKRREAIIEDIQKQISYASTALNIAGEQESSITKQEMAFKALIGGEDYLKNSMDDRLKLAQALTKEADEQEKSSSRLVDLFKIIKKYGQDVAQEVSNFLGGMLEFKQLSPQALGALKRTLPGEFERGQAQQFFTGTGFVFPEEVEKERIRARNVQILESVMIEPIQINVNLESEQVIDRVKEAINKELDNAKSEFSEKINKQIENF